MNETRQYDRYENSLANKRHDIAKEWNYEKNDGLEPEDVSYGSTKNVWWTCAICGSEWEQKIFMRTQRNSSCPECRLRLMRYDSSLLKNFPKLAEEWNLTKNDGLDYSQISYKARKLVWWKCAKGHEWQSMIHTRVNENKNCPICNTKDTGLSEKYPQLAKEWDKEKNKNKSLDNYSENSHIKVWWKCENGHKWEQAIRRRIAVNQTCMFCEIDKKNKENSIASKAPHLINEIHPVKNEKIDLGKISCRSGQYLWWKCSHGHTFEMSVASKVDGKGCPYCLKKNRVVTFIHEQSSTIAKEWNREKNLPLVLEDITTGSHKNVWWICDEGHEWQQMVYMRFDERRNTSCPFCQEKERLSVIKKEYSHLFEQWDEMKNGPPEYKLYPGSDIRVYWKCSYGHEWNDAQSIRAKNINCPICQPNEMVKGNFYEVKFSEELVGRKRKSKRKKPETYWRRKQYVHYEDSVEVLFPKLMNEWDFSKNKVKPAEITPGSIQKVHWNCSKGHSWLAPIVRRTSGEGCPKCAKKNYSNECIEWLQSISNKENIHIQHALNGGEKRIKINDIKYFKVDGYCGENNTIYEYFGCVYHADTPENCLHKRKYYPDEPNPINKRRLNKEIYADTMERIKILENLGFNVITIWECRYKAQKKNNQ